MSDNVTRTERFLEGILNGETETNIEPATRKEILLAGILNGERETNVEPATREEALLKEILLNGGGGGGGGGDAFAAVKVIYDSGSVCSITNGDLTFVAPDTSGTVLFTIPAPAEPPETWTLTLTNGVKTKTKTLSVSTYGEIINITIGDIEELRVLAGETDYMRLSTTSGDRMSCGGRSRRRTSAEPVLFLNSGNTSSAYAGYGAVSVFDSFSGTNETMYAAVSRVTYTTPKGYTVYLYYMANGFENPSVTYTVAGSATLSGPFSKDLPYIDKTSKTPQCTDATKLNNAIDLIEKLYEAVSVSQ